MREVESAGCTPPEFVSQQEYCRVRYQPDRAVAEGCVVVDWVFKK